MWHAGNTYWKNVDQLSIENIDLRANNYAAFWPLSFDFVLLENFIMY